MTAIAISTQDASLNVYNAVANLMHHASDMYSGLQKVTNFLDSKTDNAIGRFSGAAYYAKTLKAVVGAFKDVDTHHIAEMVRDPAISLKDKIKDIAHHVADKFSHESTVAAGLFAGKAAVITPIAVGVATMVSMAAPVSAVVAAGVISTGLTKAACYYLSTHHGHGFESSVADKVAKASKWLLGIRSAATGEAPEYKHMAEIGDKMEAEGHKLKALDDKHGHDHKGHDAHGHHHHEHIVETLKKDFGLLVKPITALYNWATGKKPEPEAKHDGVTASKFAATKPAEHEHKSDHKPARPKPHTSPA